MTPAHALPVFRGWTVDTRLREFRRVRLIPAYDMNDPNAGIRDSEEPDYEMQFRPFSTPAGAVMLKLYQKERN